MPKEIKHEFIKLDEEKACLTDLLNIIEKEAKTQELIQSTSDMKTETMNFSRSNMVGKQQSSRIFQARSMETLC